jgi:hypothetical protein
MMDLHHPTREAGHGGYFNYGYVAGDGEEVVSSN